MLLFIGYWIIMMFCSGMFFSVRVMFIIVLSWVSEFESCRLWVVVEVSE